MAKDEFNPGEDFLKSRKNNNIRSTKSSKSNKSKETEDTLKDLDLTSRKVKEINDQKLKGEKKITDEKKKQNKQEENIVKNLKEQVTQERKLKDLKSNEADFTRQMVNNQKQIIKEQYNQKEILRYIENYTKNAERNSKDELKFQKERLKTVEKTFDNSKRAYDEEFKKLKQKNEFNRKINDTQSNALKDLYKQNEKFNNEISRLENERAKLQDRVSEKKFKSDKRAEQYAKALAKRLEENNKMTLEAVENQEKLNDKIKEQEEIQGKINKYNENAKNKSEKKSFTDSILGKLTGADDDTLKDLHSSSSELREAASKSLKASVKSEMVSTALKVVTDSIELIFNKWLDRFKSGFNEIISTYEATYTKVSAMTDITTYQYQNWQNDVVKELKAQGLDNNVRISDIMKEMDNVVGKGITDFKDASSYAMNSTIVNQIVPYLDSQSDAYITLSQQLGPKFQKSIAGMGEYVSNQVGQNRFLTKNLNTIVDGMQYMTLAARKELMSGEDLAQIEELMKNNGWTQEQALNYYTMKQDVLTDRYSAMQSGDMDKQILAATALTSDDMDRKISEMVGWYKGIDTNSIGRTNDIWCTWINNWNEQIYWT